RWPFIYAGTIPMPEQTPGSGRTRTPLPWTQPKNGALSSVRGGARSLVRRHSLPVGRPSGRRPRHRKLQDELLRLARVPVLVIDEVGYIPFEPEAANLFFQLISGRYERASVIVTSNKPFGRWGEVFGDDTVAAAMIDRLVHHADVLSLKGDSYRLKDRDIGRTPSAATG
ncbi:ATP-binding protein, partial [Streptomyces sp. NPDC006739]|uniref:ATP-binding protein n=1 Tax=Streptomyces sp. NPDC006739 TaxID=3364763 RepID=UPI00368DDA24